MHASGFRIAWSTEIGCLASIEPRLDEVVAHAAELASGYNEPTNARLMGHAERISENEVVAYYETMRARGASMFLLFFDDRLVGDADVRGVRDGAAEFAFMIAARDHQGRGLGTRFAIMLHAFAFGHLGLHHVYASVVPENAASRRVFEKLGYVVDESATARAYADEPGDVTLSIDRERFERLHLPSLSQLQIAPR